VKSEESLVFDSRRLHRQPGSSLTLRDSASLAEGFGNEVMHPAVAGAEVEVLLESVLDGILATGTAEVPFSGECVRCLEPVSLSVPVEFRQFFAYPGADRTDRDSDVEDDDVSQLEGDELHLEAAFRDAVLLALPLSPVCSPDCPGLCAQCGVRLADEPGHTHNDPDPRWSQLAHLRAAGQSSEGE
jgi:uncharacterized protein